MFSFGSCWKRDSFRGFRGRSLRLDGGDWLFVRRDRPRRAFVGCYVKPDGEAAVISVLTASWRLTWKDALSRLYASLASDGAGFSSVVAELL